MTRYVIRPRQWIEDDVQGDIPLLPEICVTESSPVNTGMVDRHGNAILRLNPPVGFGRDGEW